MVNPGRAFLVGLILIAAIAGCSSGGNTDSEGEPDLPARLAQVDLATFALPLDAYTPTNEQSRSLAQAQNMLLARCLKRFGYTIEIPNLPSQRVEGRHERRYLITSESRAHAYGYKVPEITNQPRIPEPSLPPAADAVITGRGAHVINGQQLPEGGCMGEARGSLGIDLSSQSANLVPRLSGDAYSLMKKDTRVVSAITRWSSCMQKRGYHYKDPGHANDDPTFSTPVATQQEIATAVADVSCKKETNLVNIMAAAETAYQQRAISRNQEALNGVRDQMQLQVRKAADVVAGK